MLLYLIFSFHRDIFFLLRVLAIIYTCHLYLFFVSFYFLFLHIIFYDNVTNHRH